MKTLSCDIETYSSVDLGKCGVYKYVESPDFEILLIAIQMDGEEQPTVFDVKTAPYCLDKAALTAMLVDPEITKTAWNANFEITCLSRWLGVELPADQWRDTMITAADCGGFWS